MRFLNLIFIASVCGKRRAAQREINEIRDEIEEVMDEHFEDCRNQKGMKRGFLRLTDRAWTSFEKCGGKSADSLIQGRSFFKDELFDLEAPSYFLWSII